MEARPTTCHLDQTRPPIQTNEISPIQNAIPQDLGKRKYAPRRTNCKFFWRAYLHRSTGAGSQPPRIGVPGQSSPFYVGQKLSDLVPFAVFGKRVNDVVGRPALCLVGNLKSTCSKKAQESPPYHVVAKPPSPPAKEILYVYTRHGYLLS